jgi:hypothetical protein
MKITKLENLNACDDAKEWVKRQKSASEAWETCNRGDWMLWLAKRLDVDDKKLTLTKAMCAKQVEHLLKDQRSIDALQGCFDYSEGRITRADLDKLAYAASYAADAASDAAYDASSYAASYAASYASSYADAAYAAADAAYDAASYDAAADAATAYAAAYAYAAYDAAARDKSLKKSADICREILTEEVLKKYKRYK